MAFNDQQKAAIASTGNVIVSAGAGSGKTAILTVRINNNIRDKGINIDEILILTFANDAANEMRVRLKTALSESPKTSALVPLVDGANICTFDAYFLYLVKKYANVLGLSSDISIIPDDIISVKKNELLRGYLTEMAENPSKVNDIIFQNYIKKNINDFFDVIMAADKAFGKTVDWDSLKNKFKNEFLSDEGFNKFFDAIASITKNELEKARYLFRSVKDTKYINQFKEYQPLYDNLSLENYIKFFNNKSLRIMKGETKISDFYRDQVVEIITKLKDIYRAIDFDKVKEKDIEFNKIVIPSILDLVQRLEEDTMKYKIDKGAYVFEDIANMAFNLLKDHEDIRNEIKNKLKLIMIDEYQDTSIFQEDFINMISNNNVFVVGDVKQSIYAFRDANPKQFTKKYNKYKPKDNEFGTCIDMNTNYRSRVEITDAVNEIFAEIMTEKYGGANYKPDHIIAHGNDKFETIGKTFNKHGIFSLGYRNDGKNAAQKAQYEIEAIAKNIKARVYSKMQVYDRDLEVLRDCEYRDFAILASKGKHFKDIEKIFNNEGIPVNAVYDENIINDDGVVVLINILKLICGFNSKTTNEIEMKHALFSVLRSFLYQTSDDDLYKLSLNNLWKQNEVYKKIEKFSKEHKDSLIHDTYIDILSDFNFLEKFTLLGNAINKMKFNKVFYDRTILMDDFGYTLENFIEYLEMLDKLDLKMQTRNSSDVKNAVTVTTIHKSKGLQYGIVYMPFHLEEGQSDKVDFNRFFVNKDYGIYLPSLFNEENKNIHTLFAPYFIKDEKPSEIIRLLYVALTRAQEEVVILNKRTPTFEEFMSDYSLEKLKEIQNSKGLHSLETTISALKHEYEEQFMEKEEFEDDVDENGNLKEKQEEYVEEETLEDERNKLFESITTVGNVLQLASFEYEPEFYDDYIKTYFKNWAGKDLFEAFEKYKYYLPQNEQDILYWITKSNDELKVSINKHVGEEIFKIETKDDEKKDEPKEAPSIKIDNYRYTFKPLGEKVHASKVTSDVEADLNKLKFGTHLHLLLEGVNFKTKDTSFIKDSYQREKIDAVLKNPIFDNTENAIFYKEYEYYDEIHDMTGIIDLLVEKDDEMLIIDYKTKNIDDEAYDKQLNVYKDYIQRKFVGKEVKCYLLSIMDNVVREIK